MSEKGTQKTSLDEGFISYLESVLKRDDRAILADLRRGLGKEPGTVMEMFPHIARFVQTKYRGEENAYFLVASLFALYPTSSWASHENYNNLGKSLSFLKEESDSIEKRFLALLNSDEEDLPNHLRQIISLLKSNDKLINWLQLLKDIKAWKHEDKYVQRNWAKGFWGNASTNTENSEKGEEN